MAKDEVLIVGAGPVGLVMASELVRHGAKIRIIDKSATYAIDSRAVGVHARNLELFEQMGILPEFLKKGKKVTGINIHSNHKRLLHGEYKGFDTPHCFILDIPQTETELILIHHLESQGVKIDRNAELVNLEQKEDCVEVMIRSDQRSPCPDQFSYVVGCDGARSNCRHLTNTPFLGLEYPSHWIVFDAKLDWSYDSQELQLFFHEDGVSGFFPLPHERMRVTTELQPLNEKGDYPPATYELALSLLRERVEPDLNIEEPKDISAFIIHHRQATRYQIGRVFLAGDAAHLHSPAGGQGMNTGMQDAYNLAWKLALVLNQKGRPDILKSYHLERHPIAQDVLKMTDRMMKMISTNFPGFSLLRDTAMSVMGSFSNLSTQLPKRLSQLFYIYERNDYLVDEAKDHPSEHIQVGGRTPDHTVSQKGKEVRLFDLFKGPHHTLLLFAGKKPSQHELESLMAFSHPQIKTYYLYRNESDLKCCPAEGQCLLDLEPSCHTHYGITKTTAVLVRPDNVIGLIQEPPNLKNFKNYLNKVFL